METLDARQVLADVAAGKIAPSWRVIRGTPWRAVRYALLVAILLALPAIDSASSLGNVSLPAPWGAFVSSLTSLPALTALALALAGAAAIKPALDSRTHVVALLPEGFVYGNIRTGRVYRALTYNTSARLALGTGDVSTTQLVMEPKLSWRNEHGVKVIWSIPSYFTLSPMWLAALTLIQSAQATQAQSPDSTSAPAAGSPALVSAAATIALARAGHTPASWLVIQTRKAPTFLNRWTTRLLIYPMVGVLIAFLLFFLGWMIYYVGDTVIVMGVMGGASVFDTVNAIAPALFFILLFAIFLVMMWFGLPFVSMERGTSAERQVTVVTPEGVVIGDRLTGAIMSACAWRDVVRLEVAHVGAVSFFHFLPASGKRVTVQVVWAGAEYYTKPPEQLAQALLERVAQTQVKTTAG